MEVKKTKEDVLITNKIAEETSHKKAGVATFQEGVILYRGTHAVELYDVIIDNKKMRGGLFSVKAESRMGASFASEKEEAVNAVKANRKLFTRRGDEVPKEYSLTPNQKIQLKGDSFVITIKADYKQFLHLELSKKVPNKEGVYFLPDNFANLGLGFSVRGVTKKDIIKIEQLVDGKLEDVTNRITTILKQYYDERINKYPRSIYGISDEEFAKLSPNGVKNFVNYLKNSNLDIDDLTPLKIKKIGLKNLSEIIDEYLKDFYIRQIKLSDSFVLKYFSTSQLEEYMDILATHGLGYSKKLEKRLFDEIGEEW